MLITFPYAGRDVSSSEPSYSLFTFLRRVRIMAPEAKHIKISQTDSHEFSSSRFIQYHSFDPANSPS